MRLWSIIKIIIVFDLGVFYPQILSLTIGFMNPSVPGICLHTVLVCTFLDTLSILEWIGRYITHFGTRLLICHTAPLSQMMSHSEPDGVSLWHFKKASGRDDGDLLSPAVIMDAPLKLQLVRFGGHVHMEPCQCDNKVFKLRGSGPTKLSDLSNKHIINILYIHVTRILSL